jgi:hypothetical protein
MVPGCSLDFRELFEVSDGRKFAHTHALDTSAEDDESNGTDGKPRTKCRDSVRCDTAPRAQQA